MEEAGEREERKEGKGRREGEEWKERKRGHYKIRKS